MFFFIAYFVLYKLNFGQIGSYLPIDQVVFMFNFYIYLLIGSISADIMYSCHVLYYHKGTIDDKIKIVDDIFESRYMDYESLYPYGFYYILIFMSSMMVMIFVGNFYLNIIGIDISFMAIYFILAIIFANIETYFS